MLDLIIIGGGPAGVAAGIYAARKKLTTAFITPDWGGQSIVSQEIFNWVGTPSISGEDLANSLRTHLEAVADTTITIHNGHSVTKLEPGTTSHTVTLENGETLTARAILIATGSGRRKLNVPGAADFEHKGLTYCASCDGPLFSGRDVVVIGGGNAGFETAAQLLAYTKSVTLLQRAESFNADPITVEKVLAYEHMRAFTNTEPIEVLGNGMVTGIRYKNNKTGMEHELATGGIFVEIGVIPNTTFVKDIVELDTFNRIIIDPWTQKTSIPGIWAAGDCTNIKYHQNNISAGNGVTALEDIYLTLTTK